ncbi:HD domain-containing protein [Luteipulveratus sp. YIM 133132]|uniref:HD-GYP domain-containing protein n=1 Tax=Luteipulveratus flavus TaxID=3031728 RepID=UPI0023AEF007|nr:HD domain-containing phosphohydrolase [Luteipulveratus sp. YIM 133132]MDE9365885.1 HD domain-containing protein [Luteipulveratus sp. YIM 133132]
MSGTIGAVAGWVYVLLSGHVGLSRPASVDIGDVVTQFLLPLMIANISMFCINAVLLAGIVSITSPATFAASFFSAIRSGWMTYVGYGVVAFLFAELWVVESLGAVAILLILAPLTLAQWSISQQAAERQIHYQTVATLVAAVEARHPTTRGTSQEVNQVSGLIGDELKLRARAKEALRFAAVLRNVGLIAPVERSPEVPGKLDGATLERIYEHPDRGVAMLSEIDFLRRSSEAIRFHHERWDGGGYPNGLQGEAIPVLSRIISVADGYVALARKEENIDVRSVINSLRRRAGGQFDPECVLALERAYQRGRLETLRLSVPNPSDLDHADPTISDLMMLMRLGEQR